MSSDNCITRPVAKAVWGYVGVCNGADCIPNSVEQYYLWIEKILPRNIISMSIFKRLEILRFTKSPTKRVSLSMETSSTTEKNN
jgi:hypothetical protein